MLTDKVATILSRLNLGGRDLDPYAKRRLGHKRGVVAGPSVALQHAIWRRAFSVMMCSVMMLLCPHWAYAQATTPFTENKAKKP